MSSVVPSLFKSITDISATGAYPNGSLEQACRSQMGDYTDGSVNIQDIAYDETSGVMCAVGNYSSDGTATNTGGDTIAAQYIPLVATATVGALTPESTTWVLDPQYDCVSIVLQSPNTEQSALVSVIALPNGVSTNWVNETFIAVGHANTDMTAIGPGFSAMIAPNSNMTPIIVSARTTGTTLFESSNVAGSRAAWAWNATGGATISAFQPNLLGDIVYDSQNDQIVAVGSAVPSTGGPTSSAMIVESDFGGFPERWTFCLGVNNGAGTPTAPAFLRTIAHQDTDAAGVQVANRTLCLIGGSSNFNGVNIGKGCLGVYQPDFSNAWTAGNERLKWLDSGHFDTEFWRRFVGNTAGGTSSDYYTSVTAIDRVTTDEEDIYVIMGATANGPSIILGSGLLTGLTATPTVFDNVVDSATSYDVKFSELKWRGDTLQANLPNGYSSDADIAPYRCIGLENRKTKVISGGVMDDGAILPVSSSGGTGFLISMSRAGIAYTPAVQDAGLLPQNTASFLTTALVGGSEVDKFYIVNSRIGALSFSSPTTGNLTNIATVIPITNNKAEAYFEYILYDGIDALIAKKLQQLGVRVTITNLEWYKQDILKEGLDLDADFFREWATAQTIENEQRDKLTSFYGPTRPQKREVREPFFDDYANREEILKEMDKHREESPLDEAPYNDEVAEDNETKKLEKDLDDKIRIQNLVDEETADDNKT